MEEHAEQSEQIGMGNTKYPGYPVFVFANLVIIHEGMVETAISMKHIESVRIEKVGENAGTLTLTTPTEKHEIHYDDFETAYLLYRTIYSMFIPSNSR